MPSTVSGRERSERAPLASTGVVTGAPCAPLVAAGSLLEGALLSFSSPVDEAFDQN